MNRGQAKTTLFAIFAVISIGALVLIVAETQGISYSQKSIDTNYAVEFAEESLAITDSIHAEILHPLLGTIQFSEDGTACWMIEDNSGSFYYRLMEECPSGF